MLKIIEKNKLYNKITLKIFSIKLFSYYVDYDGNILLKNMLKNGIGSFLAIFISNKIKRKKFRRNFVSKIITDPKIKRREEAVKPYAFIRVKNEIITIDTCLNSLLPAIDRGVIAFNDCNDGTEEYIMEFCKIHKGFISYKYPYSIYSLDDPRNAEKGNDEHKLHTYYNKAVSLIPKNEWLIKIDADQTYEADKLKNMFYLPKDENDAIIFGILNLHYDGKDVYFIKDYPYLITPDHWLIFNNNIEFELQVSKNKNRFSCVEHLNISSSNLVFTETSSYHFPFVKKNRNFLNKDSLADFDKFIKTKNGETSNLYKYIEDKGLPYFIDSKILNKNHILDLCKTFNMSSKRILPNNKIQNI